MSMDTPPFRKICITLSLLWLSVWRSNIRSLTDTTIGVYGLSCTTKLIVYKTVTVPVFIYSSEAWALLNTDAAALRVFGIKFLSKIFDSVLVGNDFRIQSNS